MKIVVRLDPTRCRGHGICALMFPDGVELDRWGYGRVLDDVPGGRRSLVQARRAQRACPNEAISFTVEESDAGSHLPGTQATTPSTASSRMDSAS